MRRHRIAVLLHRRQTERDLRRYLIKHLAEIWRGDGLEVVFLSGPATPVPADVLIVHVDLSIVPDEYLAFARQYPVTVNARVRDIRKAAFSRQRVARADDYTGKVIVKSNLNYGGVPERRLGRAVSPGRLRATLGSTTAGAWIARRLGSSPRYAIYDRAEQVPPRFFATDEFIVERFLPEVEDGRYHVRYFDFLGDRFTCLRTASAEPVIRGETVLRTERVEPHPELFEWRRRLNLDYGKLDYVIHDGELVVLDVNKTSGSGAIPLGSDVQSSRRRHWASGIYDYLS